MKVSAPRPNIYSKHRHLPSLRQRKYGWKRSLSASTDGNSLGQYCLRSPSSIVVTRQRTKSLACMFLYSLQKRVYFFWIIDPPNKRKKEMSFSKMYNELLLPRCIPWGKSYTIETFSNRILYLYIYIYHTVQIMYFWNCI